MTRRSSSEPGDREQRGDRRGRGDARERVDAIVAGHHLDYSLMQLRLFGLLLLATLLLRAAALAAFGWSSGPLQQLDALEQLSLLLPLLPLALLLALLGGGRQRPSREGMVTDGLRLAMPLLALVCLLLLPLLTGQAYGQLQQRLADRRVRLEELLQLRHELQDPAFRGEASQLNRLATAAGLPRGNDADTPLEVRRRNLERQLEIQISAYGPASLTAVAPGAAEGADSQASAAAGSLSEMGGPQQPGRLLAAWVSQVMTGVTLLWLSRQGGRLIRRHGLSPDQFFRSDPRRQRSGG